SDSLGEFDSILFAFGNGTRIQEIDRILYPHSIGAVYSAITEFLGFEMYSGEGKVMGLSAYGKIDSKLDLSPLIQLNESGKFVIDTKFFVFQILPWSHNNWISKHFLKTFGPKRGKNEPIDGRHADIARSLQDITDNTLMHLCTDLSHKTCSPNLCYAGGVALNGYGNSRILTEKKFSRLFVQPAANDGGTSLGAALYHSHHTLGIPRTICEGDSFLGPHFTVENCEKALRATRIPFHRSENLVREAAKRIFDGRIIGWFQGRMELGPRALGHRSILANPCDPRMKDHLNLCVKHRESFRPFAPVVTEDKAEKFFDLPAARSPYMLLIVPVRREWRDRLPAITHIDGTARVQTVNPEGDPKMFELLLEFERLSGVQILLNTSFNGPSEPIVCTPEDAIRTFQNHRIDDLVLEDFLTDVRF
ncbi:carbamoyl transferase, partial [bacterium]|nr:carbamoyl transferase [bacterium]